VTTDPDAHGWTADDIRRALAQPTDEPRERLDPPTTDTPEDQPT